MMMCVSSVTYTILMKFDPVAPIVSSIGMQHGAPLSPYLVIPVADIVSHS